MNNELLIGICWSAGAFIVTAFVVYLEYRRDQRRTKRGAGKGGKHQTPNARGFYYGEQQLTIKGLFHTFPGKPGLKARNAKDFYYRICGGWQVMERICARQNWYRFDNDNCRIRVFDHDAPKNSHFPVSRSMACFTDNVRARVFAELVNIHKAEAAKRGVTVNIWER